MKINKKLLILTTFVCLLPILAGAAVYSRLPEQVPTNFSFAGTVSGYSNRTFAVFGLPCMMAALNLFLHLCLHRDPKQGNQSITLRSMSFWLIPAVSLLCSVLILGAALGYAVHTETVLPCFLGLLLVVIGNDLPKTKQNATMGIRIKWTRESAENWDRTHRVTGFLWVLIGFIFLILSLFHVWGSWIRNTLLVVLILFPFLYSYWLHRCGI